MERKIKILMIQYTVVNNICEIYVKKKKQT